MELTKEELKDQGRRIKKIRQEQNLKQDDFCAALGISRFSLGRIERGDQSIDATSLYNLKTKYDVSADWILFGKDLGANTALEKELETLKQRLADKEEIIHLLKKTAGLCNEVKRIINST